MAVLLPRYPIPGYEGMDPEAAAALLHQRKNRPDGPDLDMLMQTGVVRPYETLTAEEKAFPCALYRAWEDGAREKARIRAARQLQLSLKDPLDLETIDAYIGAYDSVLAHDEAQRRLYLGQGWSETPGEAKQAAFNAHRQLATDAAVSYTDDHKILSPRALAERERIDDAQNDHTPDIPRTPAGPRGTRVKT